LTLYGVGVTVGAGIYVLIGAVARHAGVYAPLAFLIAAVVMGLTVASYAELCARFPVAAGEAAYVRAAFGSRWMSTLTGASMIAAGVVATATVALGAAGYIAQFSDMPRPIVVTVVIISLAFISGWGVLESVVLACLFTVIELGGLVLIVVAAWQADLPIASSLTAIPAFNLPLWGGIGLASLLAFFAFTGFEDLTNMAEETHSPERNIPIAMAVTLIVTTTLYVAIAATAVTAISIERLAASAAPLSLLFQELAGISPTAISVIAIVATLNTIIAQMTMAIRVVYGMASQGDLPSVLARVGRTTSTPLLATAAIAILSLGLALIAPFEGLAETTSLATLFVFALVNLALIKIRMSRTKAPPAALTVPVVVPVLGLVTCFAMAAAALF
jgi:amino acid transporter